MRRAFEWGASASIGFGSDAYAQAEAVQLPMSLAEPAPPTWASRRRCAFIDGFSLHADTSVDAADRASRPRAARPLPPQAFDLGRAPDRASRWPRRVPLPTPRSLRTHIVGHRRTHLVQAARDPDPAAPKSHHPVPRRFVLCPRLAFARRSFAPHPGPTREHERGAAHGNDAGAQARLGRAVTQGFRRRGHPVSALRRCLPTVGSLTLLARPRSTASVLAKPRLRSPPRKTASTCLSSSLYAE